MRIVLLALTFFAAMAGNAHAQSWEGPYAGVHGGYRWGNLDLSSPAYTFSDGVGGTVQVPGRAESYSLNSVLIGGHAGYNILLNQNWLIGIEGDFTAAGGASKGSSASFSSTSGMPCYDDDEDDECRTITTNSGRISNVELGWQATLRARLGLIDGSTMYYITGGLAWLQADWDETIAIQNGSSETVSKDAILPGWAVGFGTETFISQDWIARLEYLYEDFSSTSIPLAFTSSTGTIDATAHKLRLALSLKF